MSDLKPATTPLRKIYKIKRFNQRTGEVTVEKPKDQYEKFLIQTSEVKSLKAPEEQKQVASPMKKSPEPKTNFMP